MCIIYFENLFENNIIYIKMYVLFSKALFKLQENNSSKNIYYSKTNNVKQKRNVTNELKIFEELFTLCSKSFLLHQSQNTIG